MTRRLTTEEFVEKARTTHGDKYSYSRVVYVRSADKVIITCPDHGDFEQAGKDHLAGKGCITCSGRKKMSTTRFTETARRIHGDKYLYVAARYVNNKSNVTILCPEHGPFNQRPDHHLSGSGCPSCAGNLIKTTKQFIEEASRTHEGLYSYGRSEYLGAYVKIIITCKEHGDFEQLPSGHLQGKGCHACSPGGFNSDKKSYIYLLIDLWTRDRVKIGVSNTPKNRIRFLRENTPFDIELMDLFETPPGNNSTNRKVLSLTIRLRETARFQRSDRMV